MLSDFLTTLYDLSITQQNAEIALENAKRRKENAEKALKKSQTDLCAIEYQNTQCLNCYSSIKAKSADLSLCCIQTETEMKRISEQTYLNNVDISANGERIAAQKARIDEVLLKFSEYEKDILNRIEETEIGRKRNRLRKELSELNNQKEEELLLEEELDQTVKKKQRIEELLKDEKKELSEKEAKINEFHIHHKVCVERIQRVKEEGREAQIRQKELNLTVAKLQSELAQLSEKALSLEKMLSLS